MTCNMVAILQRLLLFSTLSLVNNRRSRKRMLTTHFVDVFMSINKFCFFFSQSSGNKIEKKTSEKLKKTTSRRMRKCLSVATLLSGIGYMTGV